MRHRVSISKTLRHLIEIYLLRVERQFRMQYRKPPKMMLPPFDGMVTWLMHILAKEKRRYMIQIIEQNDDIDKLMTCFTVLARVWPELE